MPCASSYKNGASKFEVGPLDSKEYCISAIGEVKRNAAKWICHKGSRLSLRAENYPLRAVDLLWMFMGCILTPLRCYIWHGGGEDVPNTTQRLRKDITIAALQQSKDQIKVVLKWIVLEASIAALWDIQEWGELWNKPVHFDCWMGWVILKPVSGWECVFGKDSVVVHICLIKSNHK
jgi:hypothetical protein